MLKREKRMDSVGLRLSPAVLRTLRQRGIFAQSAVRLAYQHLSKRCLVRGVESGGAAGDIGHYVTFASEDGGPAEFLYPVESIGVNGPHSVVLGPGLVRIEMLRKAQSCELLITQHRVQLAGERNKPRIETSILFRGIHGRLELELRGPDGGRAALPIFYTLAGEEVGIPRSFRNAVRAITAAVHCMGCSHCHYTRAMRSPWVENTAKGPLAGRVEPVIKIEEK